MKKIIVDLRHITNQDELYDTIAAAFDFPTYFGRNLDALFDLLTEISDDTCVGLYLPEAAASEDAQALLDGRPSYIDRLMQTFIDAESENTHLCLLSFPLQS